MLCTNQTGQLISGSNFPSLGLEIRYRLFCTLRLSTRESSELHNQMPGSAYTHPRTQELGWTDIYCVCPLIHCIFIIPVVGTLQSLRKRDWPAVSCPVWKDQALNDIGNSNRTRLEHE
jgi:hypothetical protein